MTLDRIRSMAIAEEQLAQSLGEITDVDRFCGLVAQAAAARGMQVSAEAVRKELQFDHLGAARWMDNPVSGSAWPPPPWLPIQILVANNDLVVDWAYFGAAPITDPFFEGAVRRALRRPFNSLFRYRTSLANFIADAANAGRSLRPDGFIFHMSRCGSTLVSQMLTALPRTVVIAEAAPIDTVVQFSRTWPHPPVAHADMLRAIVAAFGRRRAGDETRYFLKLDSWHTLALPLFACAFPDVPWLFLYRDPVEVLVSQERQRGTQMVPEIVAPGLYGLEEFADLPDSEYCARVLNKICGAAVVQPRNALFVNYRDLPEAVTTRILPHFGLKVDEAERGLMQRTARRDAKYPETEFTADSAAKQREASEPLRAIAAHHLGAIYDRLEALAG